MTPLISVITPTYNIEKYVDDTLKSVREQRCNPSLFELILFDDGSTDTTVRVMEKACAGIQNAHIYAGENQGAAAARNRAIKQSEGKYLLLLDGDDLLHHDAIGDTLRFMEEHPGVAFSYSRHQRIDEDGNFLCKRPGYPYSRDRILHYNFVGHLKCITRELFDKLGGFKADSYVEDYDFTLQASEVLDEGQIAQNPAYLYEYRMHESNKSSQLEQSRTSSARAIQASLKRKEGIDADVRFSHMTEDNYSFFVWRDNASASNT